MVKFLIERPIAVIMGFLAFVILGVVTYFAIPVSLLPDVDIPHISVRIDGAGKSARELENTVTAPLRRQLQQVSGMSEIKSVTRDGSAEILMDFEYGVDTDLAFIAANEKIDGAMSSLPRDIERPKIIKASAVDIPVLYINVTLRSDADGNESRFVEMARVADNELRRSLEQLPEVSMVDVTGVPRQVLRITPDRVRMRSLGITDADITSALQNANASPGSMTVREGYYEYKVSISNSLRTSSDVGRLNLKVGDRLIPIGDIAEIEETIREPQGYSFYNGNRAVTLAVIKQSEENIDAMRSEISRVTEDFSKSFPDYEVSQSRNQTELLDATISGLTQNLVLGLILVFLVTAIFLGDVRTPFVIGISILVALALTVLVFYLTGVSLNIVSLSGLILAVGMMIDNSVIVTENITQYRAMGERLPEACRKGTNEMITPLLSSSLTTVAVFVPLIFMSGIAGAIFADQAFSITAGLAMSYVTGITLLPVLYKLFFTRRGGGERAWKATDRLDKALDCLYDHVVGSVFRHKALWVGFTIVSAVACVALFMSMKAEKMPQVERTEAMARIEWNEPVSAAENARRVAEVSRRATGLCEEHSAAVGVQDYMLDGRTPSDIETSEIYLRASGIPEIKAAVDTLRADLQCMYPLAQVDFDVPDNIFDRIFGSDMPEIEARLTIRGENVSVSPHAFGAIRERIAASAGQPDQEPALRRQTDIIPSSEKMALYDIDPSVAFGVLSSAFRDNDITTLRTSEMYVPVALSSAGKTLTESLESAMVESRTDADGNRYEIPLSRLVSVGESEDFKEIVAGRDGEYLPLGYESAPQPEKTSETIISEVRDEGNWNVELAGAWFANRKMIKEMTLIMLVSLVMMYFILCAQFESFLQPLIVLIEIPIDTAFALLALKLTGNTLNIMSAIGIIVTCGIVVNDSILKLDAINTLRRSGMPLLEAIHTAGIRRLRPILMTSLTTIFAMVPMLFTDDLGSRLQRPLSIAMTGSMTVGTLVSIFIIPLIYYLIYRKSHAAETYTE